MSRKILSLNKGWKFHRGDVSGDENLHSFGARGTNAGVLSGPAGKNYGDLSWRDVDVPHDFVNEGPFGPQYDMMHGYRERPNAWYRKSFVLDESYADRQLMLCFEGVNVHCEIYFNGSLLERSFNGFQEIWVDITPRAYTDGRTNVLAVYVKSEPTQLWSYEGGGIYRNVWLYAKEHLHIARDGFFVNPVLADEEQQLWSVECEVELENSGYSPATGQVMAELSYKGETLFSGSLGEATVAADSIETIRYSFPIEKPELWDPSSPNLYDFKLTVMQDGAEADSDSCRTGFRWFYADAVKGFFLNGKHVRLNGICNHQDHGCVGIAVSESIDRYRLWCLKEMGANGFRCAHHMMNRAVYDLCDELGLMVVDENRFFETRKDNTEAWVNQVRRNRNHPSVIFYFLLNEEPLQNTEEGARIYRKLRVAAEKYDKSKLFSGGMNGSSLDGAGVEMDVPGKNYGLKLLEDMHNSMPQKPLLGSENMAGWDTRGALDTDVAACRAAGYDLDSFVWSNTAQQQWNATHDKEWFLGGFMWSGFDYRGEPQPFTWPAIAGPYGILDLCGFRKNKFYFVKAMFESEPFVKVIPHWNHKEGDVVRVVAVGNCEEAELFLNGKSLGKKVGNIGDQPAWEVPFFPGTLSAKGYNGGIAVAEDSVSTTGEAQKITLTPEFATVKNNGMDTLILRVAVTDAEGNVVDSADNMLHFTVEGDGRFLGAGNGNPTCHELDSSADHTVFHGLCQAIVAVDKAAKALKVTVSGEGLEPAVYEAEIEECSDIEFLESSPNYNISGFTMSEISAERLDPLMEIGGDDVNTFMPLDIPMKNYQSDFKGGWRIYRCVFNLPAIPEANGRYTIELGSVHCQEIEIYANGSSVYSEKSEKWAFAKPVSFDICGSDGETVELRILMKYEFNENSGGISQHVKFVV